MFTIAQALERIKGQITKALPEELIMHLCEELGHHFRQRVLDPVITTHLFVQQILQGNIAINDLRRLSGIDFTDSAYCQARQRVPRSLFERLQQAVTGFCTADVPPATWHGHRVFLLDGSSFSMPDTAELQAQFGQPSGQAAGCGFPVAHLMVLCDAAHGFLHKTLALPMRAHDIAHAPALHSELAAGDVLVGDRGFASYAHLALCRRRGMHGIFRAHQGKIISFRMGRKHQRRKWQKGLPNSRWVKRLGRRDQLVEYFKPKQCPVWMTAKEYAGLPDSLIVREIRYRVPTPSCRTRVVTLVTTLLDAERYPAAELARLYGLRWRVETNLKHLKQTLGMDILRCETVEGVLKELTLFVLVYNLVRRVMGEAAQRQGVAPHRISFIDAWRWMRYARPGDELPVLIVNPERPGRYEPRVRKRRPKEFPVMKRPREVLRKEQRRKSAA